MCHTPLALAAVDERPHRFIEFAHAEAAAIAVRARATAEHIHTMSLERTRQREAYAGLRQQLGRSPTLFEEGDMDLFDADFVYESEQRVPTPRMPTMLALMAPEMRATPTASWSPRTQRGDRSRAELPTLVANAREWAPTRPSLVALTVTAAAMLRGIPIPDAAAQRASRIEGQRGELADTSGADS